VQLRVADQACDVVVLQERIGEDLGRRESGARSVGMCAEAW
jgi:hypothetical protein